jgi:hypothetical protein
MKKGVIFCHLTVTDITNKQASTWLLMVGEPCHQNCKELIVAHRLVDQSMLGLRTEKYRFTILSTVC